jgi:hypothetical protein
MATRKLKSGFDDEAKLLKSKIKSIQIKVHILVNGTFFGIYYCEYYSLAAKYLSASSAAIHPVPAAVIA